MRATNHGIYGKNIASETVISDLSRNICFQCKLGAFTVNGEAWGILGANDEFNLIWSDYSANRMSAEFAEILLNDFHASSVNVRV